MKRLFAVSVILLAFTGCARVPGVPVEPVEPINGIDQCIRERLFKECMASLPVGPTHTQYNDWDEVVDNCASYAYHTSVRKYSSIPLECRSE